MPDSLPQESHSPEGHSAALCNGVRACTAADLPWVMSLAYRRYGSYDPGKILVFLLNVMQNQQALFLRADGAFIIASATEPIWGNELECHVVFLCAAEGAHWQAVQLLQESVEWARAKGCRKWQFGSETENDIGALAKRVGAQPGWPRYWMEL